MTTQNEQDEQAWEDLRSDGGLPESHVPRRADMRRWCAAERAIYEACLAVEQMPADVRLTDAVVALGAALDRVADYVDGVEPTRKPVPEHGEWVFVHEVGEWRCHCGYTSTSWDRFAAHFNAPPRFTSEASA